MIGNGRVAPLGGAREECVMVWAGLRDRCVAIARSEPLGRLLVYVALAVSTASISTMLVTGRHLSPTLRATFLVASLVAWMVLVLLGWARGTLPVKLLVGAIAVTLLLAVATPSSQSGDVYSYAMYGRIVTEHHRSPWLTYPMHFEGDPMRRHVGSMWQRTGDIYGLGFTTVMAGLAPLIGESTLLARLAYQALAMFAVGTILWILWRRTRHPTVLAFAGLHPLIAVSVVNGGHPDALMALAVLLGALFAMERRVVVAALVLAFAVSIKATALPVALVIGVWAMRRWTRKQLAVFASITLGFGAVPYVFLSGWMRTAHANAQMISRQSVWAAVQRLVASGGPFDLLSSINRAFPSVVSYGTMALIVMLVVGAIVRHTARATPELAVAGVIAAFFVASPWVMPWYAFAALPLLALRRPNFLTWVVAFDAALVLIGDQFPALTPAAIGGVGYQLLHLWAPIVAFAGCAFVLIARPRTPATQPVLVTA